MTQLWFKSEKFEIEDGEEAETNPFCFGRQLAAWLSETRKADSRQQSAAIEAN
jgi:hypothetical protein